MLDIILTIVGQSVLFAFLLFIFIKILERKMGATIEALIDTVFTAPTVKGAMSVLGKRSGAVRGQERAFEDAAGRVLSGQNLAGIKMLASQLGFDVDSYIEEHGAVNALQGLSQLAGLFGIDIKTVLSGGLEGLTKGLGQGGSEAPPSGQNPYY